MINLLWAVIMVGIAVETLGRRKLQELAGRWLDLVGGVAIARRSRS